MFFLNAIERQRLFYTPLHDQSPLMLCILNVCKLLVILVDIMFKMNNTGVSSSKRGRNSDGPGFNFIAKDLEES